MGQRRGRAWAVPGAGQRGDRGAAAVEFALIAPLLFMLVFGMISFGILLSQQLALTNSARQGARLAVVGDHTCDDILREVKNSGGTLLMDPVQRPGHLHVEVRRDEQVMCPDTSAATGYDAAIGATSPCRGSVADARLTVTARWDSTLMIPLVVADPSFPVEARGVFRCEFS